MRVEPAGGGLPGPDERARAAFNAGDYLRAARIAGQGASDEARAVLRAVKPDPAALWCGAVTTGIIAAYWIIVRH